jgi:GNAT superfamily N-acetyltransferase
LIDRYYIADSRLAANYYDELLEQLEKEWPAIEPVDLVGGTVPLPSVALTSAHTLAGGLVFVMAKSPLSDEFAVWVNAVLVLQEHRRQGVATRLIEAAERAAIRFGVARLFALTELPDLYRKIGWSVLRNDGADNVMMREIAT